MSGLACMGGVGAVARGGGVVCGFLNHSHFPGCCLPVAPSSAAQAVIIITILFFQAVVCLLFLRRRQAVVIVIILIFLVVVCLLFLRRQQVVVIFTILIFLVVSCLLFSRQRLAVVIFIVLFSCQLFVCFSFVDRINMFCFFDVFRSGVCCSSPSLSCSFFWLLARVFFCFP